MQSGRAVGLPLSVAHDFHLSTLQRYKEKMLLTSFLSYINFLLYNPINYSIIPSVVDAITFRLSHFLAILSAFYLLGGQLIHRRYKNASTGIILSCYIFSLIFLQCHIPIRLACQYNVSLSPNPLCLSCHETS